MRNCADISLDMRMSRATICDPQIHMVEYTNYRIKRHVAILGLPCDDVAPNKKGSFVAFRSPLTNVEEIQ